ncbi:MAG: hypothetical protein RL689_1197 [Planctomycetota bacterium]
MQPSLTTWQARLSRVANSRLGSIAWPPPEAATFVSTFRDDAGHRRPVDAAFLAHVTGIPSAPAASESPDCRLWGQAARPPAARDERIVRAALDADPRALAMGLRESGIEIWTETELACLHALTWLGVDREPRATIAARFLIEELQPDNGTNHPWAIHWFAWLECTQGDMEAGLYAQALLHNAMTAGGGVPDLFSAIIFHDAARWIAQRAVT